MLRCSPGTEDDFYATRWEGKLFEEVAYEADSRGLMSVEHFSVDGTPTEAAATMRSF